MDITNLLQRCEELDHSERVKHMVELGRKAKADVSAKSIVRNLASGSVYEKLLSLET